MNQSWINRLKTELPRLGNMDKAIIFFAMGAQSYIVGLWFYHSLHGSFWLLDAFFAICAGVALDLGVMQSATGTLKRSTVWYKDWAVLTPFIGFISSSLIAYDTYAKEWVDFEAAVHIVFPLFVWAASQYVARNRHQSIDVWIDTKARQLIEELTQSVNHYMRQAADALANATHLADQLTLINQELVSLTTERDELIARIHQLDGIDRELIALRGQLIERDQALADLEQRRPLVVNGTGKDAIRKLLTANASLTPSQILDMLSIDPDDERAVRNTRSQISQVRAELRDGITESA